MNKPTEGQKKIAALNLKSLLAIFTIELDNVIKRNNENVMPVVPNNPGGGLDDFPVVIEPALPDPVLPLQNKASSGFDMDMMDQQALEE